MRFSWSDEALRILGLSRSAAEIDPQAGFALIHPEDRLAAQAAVERAVTRGEPFELEQRLLRPDGEIRYVLSRGEIVKSEGQAPLLRGSFFDLTVLKQAEARRRASERMLQSFFDSAPFMMGVVELLPEGDVAFVAANPATARMYDLAPETLPGKRSRELGTSDEDLARWLTLYQQAASTQAPASLEYSRTLSDGEHWYRAVVSLVSQEQGRFCFVAEDISEHKRIQKQLQQQQQALEASHQELQHFLHMASHDLQEPLHTIHAFCRLLERSLREGLGPREHGYLERIKHTSEGMSLLIKDLLDYARVTGVPQALKPVDLNIVLSQVLDTLAARIQESGARLELEPLPSLLADVHQMRQLFQNLLSNSLKFTLPGHTPEITIRCQPAGPDTIALCFRDQGIGFDSQQAESLFQPFQRLHETGYSGTGIGLTICRKIVERHGGTILAESQPGQGALFRVTLPLDGP